jgi:hypothetical protein
MEEGAVETFCGITGASPEVAQGFMALSGNNVERAIELFFENPELASSVQTGVPSSNPPQPASRPNTGRQDSRGVIHIDSDDDDDMMQVDDYDSGTDDGRAAAAQAAAVAQEEEDAAMAQRLQEEMYRDNQGGGGNPMGEDGVRAPIAGTTETLVAPDPAWGDYGGGGAGFESGLLSQIRRRPMPPCKFGTFFSFSSLCWCTGYSADTFVCHSWLRWTVLTAYMGGAVEP